MVNETPTPEPPVEIERLPGETGAEYEARLATGAHLLPDDPAVEEPAEEPAEETPAEPAAEEPAPSNG